MVMQILNIVCGSLLAAPKLKEWGLGALTERLEGWLGGIREKLGLATLVLGTLALIDRLGVLSIPIPEFGASFPQSLPALAIGLLLAAQFSEQYSILNKVRQTLEPQADWIGLLGIAVGIGSLLFGCFIPQFCRGGLF